LFSVTLCGCFLLSCAVVPSAPKAAAVLAGAGSHAGGHCTLLNKTLCGKVMQQVRVVLLCSADGSLV